MAQVYLGIGSNLNRENALLFARANLAPLFKDYAQSSVWQSHAIREAEPDYLNMVSGGQTDLSLEELLQALADIEKRAGSEMMFYNGTNFGIKRRLDIDVLLYDDLVTTTPCKLPRHDIQDYPFVLCPLCELNDSIIHPLLKLPIKEIWNEMAPRLPARMKVVRYDFDWTKNCPDWS